MVAVADTSLARIVAQGLVPLTRGSDPVAAVELLLAVQGQMVRAIPWAIGARCTAVTRAQSPSPSIRVSSSDPGRCATRCM